MYRSRSTRLVCAGVAVALIALWPLTGQTFQIKEVEPGSDPEWAPVTLVAGQNVRLNLVNTVPDSPDLPPGPCQVEVTFLDASGRAIADGSVLDLGPGQSATVMGPTPHMRDGETAPATRLVRPALRFVDNPDFKGLRAARRACTVIPMMEVFSEETGGTLFLSPAALKGFNPQPDPPGQEQVR